MNFRRRPDWLFANIVSVSLHGGAILAACLMVNPRDWWQMEVSRGQTAIVVLSVPVSSTANPIMMEVVPLPEQDPVEPTIDDVRREQAQLDIERKLAEPDQWLPVDLAERKIERSTTIENVPDVKETVTKRSRKQLLAPSTDSFATAAPVIAEAGASFDIPPKKLRENKPPSYPADAQAARQEGRVILVVSIAREGNVSRLYVGTSSGHRSLDSAAIDAVRLWRFAPAKLGGIAVPAEILVPIRFTIGDS